MTWYDVLLGWLTRLASAAIPVHLFDSSELAGRVVPSLVGIAWVSLILWQRRIAGTVLGPLPTVRALSVVVPLYVIGSGALLVLAYGFVRHHPSLAPPVALYVDAIMAGRHFGESLAMYLASVVLVPVSEELVYRGMIQHYLQRKLGLVAGVLLASLAFSVFHASPLWTFPFALLLAGLYASTGSLYYSIVAHMSLNFVSDFGADQRWLAGLDPTLGTTPERSIYLLFAWLAVALLLLAATLRLHRWQQRGRGQSAPVSDAADPG